jgi:hypothetical protein
LRTAREDGPSAAARARIFGEITAAVGGATSGATALGVTAKTAGGAKLLVAGALLGSIVTVGVAAFVIGFRGPRAPLAPEPSFAMHADPEIAPVTPAAPAVPAPPAMGAAVVADPEPAATASPARRSPTRSHASLAGAPAGDTLTREATLVSEARGALVRGQPETALGALRATELLPSRAMEPEELSLEARALRALGREPEAEFVEGQLRARFPDNALAR